MQNEKIISRVADSISVVLSPEKLNPRAWQRLVDKTPEQLAYCVLFVLESAFQSEKPKQTEGENHKHWYAETLMTSTSAKIGKMVLGQGNLEWTEKTRLMKSFRVGYYLLHSLVDMGLLLFEKNNAVFNPPYRIKVVKGKEDEVTEMLSIIDTMEPLVPHWSRPLFDQPKPFTHFYHETGETMIHKCQEGLTKSVTPDEMETVFEVINDTIKTPWRINTELLDVYGEMQNDPLFTFSYKVDLTELQLSGLERERNKVLQIARLVGDRTFWQGAFYDFRGRIYSTSNYLQHSGCKLAKSLFMFKEEAELGKEGWRWLLIHAANCWGFDKATLEERFQFASDNVQEWTHMGQNLTTNEEWKKADDPFNFAAAVLEITKARQSGNKFTFKSGLPVAVDATCSGLQILSALAKDRKGAELSNLANNIVEGKNVKGDYYQMIADHVWSKIEVSDEDQANFDLIDSTLKKYKKDITNARENEDWDANAELKSEERAFISSNYPKIKSAAKVFWANRVKLGRKVCKRPCMTYFYSCQAEGMGNALLDDFQNDADFQGLVYQYAHWLTEAIYDACRELMPAATSLMDLFVRVARDAAESNKDYAVTAPLTGFRFLQEYRTDVNQAVDVLYKSKTKYIAARVVVGKAAMVNKRKIKTATAPNVVHMLDSQLVAGMIMKANYPLGTIHDSFSSTAANAQKLYDDTREVFTIIFHPEEGDLDVLSEILFATDSEKYLTEPFKNTKGESVKVVMGDYEISEVMTSEFFTC